jgi:hypothetical protein
MRSSGAGDRCGSPSPPSRTRTTIRSEKRLLLPNGRWCHGCAWPAPTRYPVLKLAGASGTKGSTDPAVAEALLAKIEEISKVFWELEVLQWARTRPAAGRRSHRCGRTLLPASR